MATDNPFANLGLGMMGQDAALARQMSTPDGASDKMKKILGTMAGGAFDAVGLKDFFDNLGKSEETPKPSTGQQPYSAGIAPPAPINADYSLSPVAPVSLMDKNALHFAPPNAMRFPPSATAAYGANPFQPTQTKNPDDEHRYQVKSAWE